MKPIFSFKGFCLFTLLVYAGVCCSQNLYVVTASSLNVRSAPSAESTIVGKVVKGDTVLVNKIEGVWGQIPFGLRYGYVSMSYIVPTTGDMKQTKETQAKQSIQRSTKESGGESITNLGDGKYSVNGKYMTSWEIRNYLKEKCPAAYNEIINSENTAFRCKKAAIALDACCAAPLGAGIGCFAAGVPVAGGVLIGLCGVLAAASIPCWVVGTVKDRSAVENGVEMYNMQCGRNSAYTPVEFRIQACDNGIGLAMKF